MPILFSAVACDRSVITKFASCDGNFTEIVEQVLSKIPPNNNKMTYSHGHYLFHYVLADKCFYFCVTDKLCQRSRAFLFLNEIQRRFKSLDKADFTPVLASEMYRYSEDYSTITIRKGELDEINTIGVGCSESILGEKILHINNVENLTFSTISYVGKIPEKIVVTVQKPKLHVAFVVILGIILGVVVYIVCPVSFVIVTSILLVFLYFIIEKVKPILWKCCPKQM